VSQSELYGKTVIEANPDSEHARLYRELAKAVAENEELVVPNPLGAVELRSWAREWGDKIFKLEQGVVEGTREGI
jgi:nitrogenase iron protein NifH